jgi:hypothetical protein
MMDIIPIMINGPHWADEEALGWIYIVGSEKYGWCRVGHTRYDPRAKVVNEEGKGSHGDFLGRLDATLPFHLEGFALFSLWGRGAWIMQIIDRKFAYLRIKPRSSWLRSNKKVLTELIELIDQLNVRELDEFLSRALDLGVADMIGESPATIEMRTRKVGRYR